MPTGADRLMPVLPWEVILIKTIRFFINGLQDVVQDWRYRRRFDRVADRSDLAYTAARVASLSIKCDLMLTRLEDVQESLDAVVAALVAAESDPADTYQQSRAFVCDVFEPGDYEDMYDEEDEWSSYPVV